MPLGHGGAGHLPRSSVHGRAAYSAPYTYSRMPPRRSHGLLETRLLAVKPRSHTPCYSTAPSACRNSPTPRLRPGSPRRVKSSTFHPARPTISATVRHTSSPTSAHNQGTPSRSQSYNGHLHTRYPNSAPPPARHLQHFSEPQEPYSLHSLEVRLRIQEHSLSKSEEQKPQLAKREKKAQAFD